MNKQLIEKLVYKSGRALNRHAPTILTCIGSVGVVITAVLAVKETPKAMILLSKAKEEKGEELTKLDTVKTAIPVYIPAVISGACTIVCIFGANVLNQKRQASLMSAYVLLQQNYARYRKAAKTVYGEDADEKINAQVAKEVYISEGMYGYALYDANNDPSSEKVLFYEPWYNRYFKSTFQAVINAQYHLNRNFVCRGGASLNEFYTFLGLDTVAGLGDRLGWGNGLLESGITWIDFDNKPTHTDDGLECCVISSLYEPTIDGEYEYDLDENGEWFD